MTNEDWGRIFILGFAYISQKLPSDPRLFSWKRRNIWTATLRIVDWNIQIL